jgi:hypothetical protein
VLDVPQAHLHELGSAIVTLRPSMENAARMVALETGGAKNQVSRSGRSVLSLNYLHHLFFSQLFSSSPKRCSSSFVNMVKITEFRIHGKCQESIPIFCPSHLLVDVRFPTSLTGDGTDAMYLDYLCSVAHMRLIALVNRNTECDYSSAYVILLTDSDLVGYGMTFTIGRGNDIVRVFRSSCFYFGTNL